MRIARFDNGRTGLVVDDEAVVDVTDEIGTDPAEWPPVAPLRTIAEFEKYTERLEQAAVTGERIPLSSVRLLTPVPWPNKIVAFPVNYHDHGQEMRADYRADHQGFFLKPPSALSGPGEPVVLPDVPGREVHHESELAVVIGRGGRGIAAADWRDHVFGYACLLDMVVRGREERVFRKAYDSFCPVGPWLTTAEEVGDPTGLEMKLWVNGQLRQHANTRDLVLDIPGMVEMASAVMTLYPGDVIATGTPAGVGPVADGDVVDISIDHVGRMSVPVRQGSTGATPALAKPYTPNIAK